MTALSTPPLSTAAAFMAAAPTPLNGSSPWASRYATDLARVAREHSARAPRSLQLHLGPSELGEPCDRQVAGKMAGVPATNHVSDPWPSIVGTAVHAWLADAFVADNARKGLLRWLAEQRVTPHPDHPGTADLYDALEQAVVDHKVLGESTMAKVRSSKGPKRAYVVQLLLYALGYHLMGLPVRRVVLAAWPRCGASLDGLFVWETPFAVDGEILPSVVELLTEVFGQTETRKGYAIQIHAGCLELMDVPSVPDSDSCFFCPFYRPQAAKDGGPGCPGTAGRNG